MNNWHTSKTGNHQGLVIEEGSGRNVAVTYDRADAPIIAAAPELLAALEGLLSESLNMNAELRKIGKGRPEDGAHPDCPIDVARAAIANAKQTI